MYNAPLYTHSLNSILLNYIQFYLFLSFFSRIQKNECEAMRVRWCIVVFMQLVYIWYEPTQCCRFLSWKWNTETIEESEKEIKSTYFKGNVHCGESRSGCCLLEIETRKITNRSFCCPFLPKTAVHKIIFRILTRIPWQPLSPTVMENQTRVLRKAPNTHNTHT